MDEAGWDGSLEHKKSRVEWANEGAEMWSNCYSKEAQRQHVCSRDANIQWDAKSISWNPIPPATMCGQICAQTRSTFHNQWSGNEKLKNHQHNKINNYHTPTSYKIHTNYHVPTNCPILSNYRIPKKSRTCVLKKSISTVTLDPVTVPGRWRSSWARRWPRACSAGCRPGIN